MPTFGFKYKLSSFDLLEIMKDDKATRAEAELIDILGKTLFLGKQVTLESGRVIQFKLEYGDVEEAWSEWVSFNRKIYSAKFC